jgi:hypothetical protein
MNDIKTTMMLIKIKFNVGVTVIDHGATAL